MASKVFAPNFTAPILGASLNNKTNNCGFWNWPANLHNNSNNHISQDPLRNGLKCNGDQLNSIKSPFDLAFDLSHYDQELQQPATDNGKKANTFQQSYTGAGNVGNGSILFDDPFANNLRLDSFDNLLLPTFNNVDLKKRPTNTTSLLTSSPSFSSQLSFQQPQQQSKQKIDQHKLVGRGIAYYKRFGWQSMDAVDPQSFSKFHVDRTFHSIKYDNSVSNDLSMHTTPSEDVEHDYSDTTGNENQQNNRYRKMECLFCKNLASEKDNYKSHWLKDNDRRITCPILRAYNCPICNNGGGDNAHTKRYCPKKREKDYFQRLGVFRRITARNDWQKY